MKICEGKTLKINSNNMKNSILLVIYICLLCITKSTYSQWIEQKVEGNPDLRDVFFVNENIGWIVGEESFVLKTTDGGENWFKQYEKIPKGVKSKYDLESIFFLDENIGWISGKHLITRTTDGGNEWIQLTDSYNLSGDYKSLYFINSEIGFILNKNNGILRTDNGGINWQINLSGKIKSIFYIDNYVFLSVDDQANIYKTTNSGDNWTKVIQLRTKVKRQGNESMRRSADVDKLFFIDLNTGWAAGENIMDRRFMYKTTNGGLNWLNWEVKDKFSFAPAFYWIDNDRGYIIASNIIYYSSDGGKNWTIQYTNEEKKNLQKIFFLNNKIGCIVGDRGIILYSNVD